MKLLASASASASASTAFAFALALATQRWWGTFGLPRNFQTIDPYYAKVQGVFAGKLGQSGVADLWRILPAL